MLSFSTSDITKTLQKGKICVFDLEVDCPLKVQIVPHMPVSNCKMSFFRYWEKFPPSPSTRQRAARSTWARTPSTVTSSAPRALRWTSWYRKEKMILWVFWDKGQRGGLCWPLSFLASGFVFIQCWKFLFYSWCFWLFNRGSFQCRSSSRPFGTAPNWWQSPQRSQADWCFSIVTTSTPIVIITIDFKTK